MPRVDFSPGNVARIKPMLRKATFLQARGVIRRNPLAAALTDLELRDFLNTSFDPAYGWEVNRRLWSARESTLRGTEPADDIVQADIELAAEVPPVP